MKHSIFILFCLLFFGCSEKSPKSTDAKVRVEAWHNLDRSVEEYQKLQPNRPILVFYTADWDISGRLAQKYLNEPRFFDLFTQYSILPLIADCTYPDRIASKEFEENHPQEIFIHCFSLSHKSSEDSWFPIGIVSSDAIYEILKAELERTCK